MSEIARSFEIGRKVIYGPFFVPGQVCGVKGDKVVVLFPVTGPKQCSPEHLAYSIKQ